MLFVSGCACLGMEVHAWCTQIPGIFITYIPVLDLGCTEGIPLILTMLLCLSKGVAFGGTVKGCREPGDNNIEQGKRSSY